MDIEALMQQMMAGPTDEQKRAARAQALAAAGFGILGANSGSGWQGAVRSLGRGGLLGMNVYNNELANQKAAPMQNLEMLSKVMGLKAQQQSMDDQQKMRDLASSSMIPGAPGAPEMGPPTAQGQMQPAVPPSPPSFDWAKYSAGLAGIDPVRAMQVKREMAKESPLDKFKPENYTPQSLSTFMRTNNPADLVLITKQESAVGKINPADFTSESVARFMQSGNYKDLVPIDKRAVTNVNMPPLETSERKAKGEQNVKYYGDLKTASEGAQKENAVLQRMAANPLETGAGVPLFGAAANWLSFGGIGGDKLKQYATDSQNFTRDAMDLVMTKQIAQKGPQTESDAKRLESTVASAKNTREANQAIIQFAMAQNKRLIEQRAFYDKWWRDKKTYEGADEAWFSGKGGTSIWDDIPGGAAGNTQGAQGSPRVIDFNSLPKSR